MTCECGCEWAGLDDVAQWCVEEAVFEAVEIVEKFSRESAGGEGTDPLENAGGSVLTPHEENQRRLADALSAAKGQAV